VSGRNPFTPRLIAAWIAAAVLTFALSLVFALHGEDTTTTGPSTFSRSAIGHAGIAELLRRRGLTVVQSRGDSAHKAGGKGILVLAEPEFSFTSERLRLALAAAPAVLLVLPKWTGAPDPAASGWIADAEPLPPLIPQSVLEAAFPGAVVVRPGRDVKWDHNELHLVPHLDDPPQLMKSDRLHAVVGSRDGMLVGWAPAKNGSRLWVLADPDVIANHGLGAGNAAFAVALFNAARFGDPIVFDEMIHGFETAPANPAALLFRRPVAEIAVQALLALALLLWAGAARFGAPEPMPAPLKAGKRDLVRKTAELFRAAGYEPVLVRRYVEETTREVARQLHAPPDLSEDARLGWLRRLGAARGVSRDCADLAARAKALAAAGHVRTAELFRLPPEIWRWKQEIMHGAAGGAGDRRGDSRGNPQGRDRPGPGDRADADQPVDRRSHPA
jgi:hypothetical protein